MTEQEREEFTRRSVVHATTDVLMAVDELMAKHKAKDNVLASDMGVPLLWLRRVLKGDEPHMPISMLCKLFAQFGEGVEILSTSTFQHVREVAYGRGFEDGEAKARG